MLSVGGGLSSGLTHILGITLSSDQWGCTGGIQCLAAVKISWTQHWQLRWFIVTSQLQISELCSGEVIWNENNETVSVSIGTRSGMCGLLLTLSLFLYLSHFFTIFSHFSALSISSCFRCEGDSSWWTQLTTCYWPFVTTVSPLDRGRSAIWPLALRLCDISVFTFSSCVVGAGSSSSLERIKIKQRHQVKNGSPPTGSI